VSCLKIAGAQAATAMLVLQVIGQGHHYEHHHQNLVLKMPLTNRDIVESLANTGVQHVRICSLNISKRAGRIGFSLHLEDRNMMQVFFCFMCGLWSAVPKTST
jgi:hypothetical protein